MNELLEKPETKPVRTKPVNRLPQDTGMAKIPEEILRLDRLIKDNVLTATAAARGIGISSSALSRLRKGEYGADTGNMAGRVGEFLALQQERDNILPQSKFVETLTARHTLKLCRISHVEGQIVVLAGPSGCGKTEALRKYARENKSVIYLAAHSACTMQATVHRIATAIGAPVGSATAIIAERVIEKLKGTNRVIIVDEADHLNLNSLEMLRYIHDESGVGIVLSGCDELIHNITGGGGGGGRYERLFTRCGAIKWLKPANKRDIKLIAEAILGTEIKDDIVVALCKVSLGCIRTVTKLLPRAWERAHAENKGKLTEKIIMETKKQLIII